jgi:hypothetical protein
VDSIAPYTNRQWDAFTFGGQKERQGHVADPALGRAEVLDRAKKLINGDRHDDYGSAEQNHERIAAIWSAVLGVNVEAWQVALCMAGVKMARLAFDPTKEDSWVDLAGYAALGGEMGVR